MSMLKQINLKRVRVIRTLVLYMLLTLGFVWDSTILWHPNSLSTSTFPYFVNPVARAMEDTQPANPIYLPFVRIGTAAAPTTPPEEPTTCAVPTTTVDSNAPSGSIPASHPTVSYAVVFVSRQIPTKGSLTYLEAGSLPGIGPYSRFEVAAPGKLMVREADASLRTLVDGSNPTSDSLNLIDVSAPDVSYDGTKLVFAGLPNGSYPLGPLQNLGAWRIYTINTDGTNLQQITFSDQDGLDLSQFGLVADLFKKYDDTDPIWLPDGRIAFSSTRWPGFGMYGGVRSTNLYVVNADGTEIHRITAERNGADRPLVDPLTGKIVYTRWWRNFRVAATTMTTILYPGGGYQQHNGLRGFDAIPDDGEEVGGTYNLERNAWHLATVNPDGTGLAQWAGLPNLFVNQGDNLAYGGGFAPDGRLYANFLPKINLIEAAGFGGIRQFHRGINKSVPVLGITAESGYKLARLDPPSDYVYAGSYAAEPEVLPDGRLIISWAPDVNQDYGLYSIDTDTCNRTLLYDNPNTTEIRARVIRSRTLPPVIPDTVTAVASTLPPLAVGPYDRDGQFTFDALNVYFNAPVDTSFISAMPVGSANTIRFFIDHQRTEQSGSHPNLDWPILLQELPVNPDGSVIATSPANVPLFEQIRTAQPTYEVPLTGNPIKNRPGAAHVAGLNFGRPGEVQRCVGCHAGHSMFPVPANAEEARWTNLAPGATLTTSSAHSNHQHGLIDRRVQMSEITGGVSNKYWFSVQGQSPNQQWVQLTFPVPISVRTVRLYQIPQKDFDVQVHNTMVRLYLDAAATNEVANNPSGPLTESGTDVAFANIQARVVRIETTDVSGTLFGQPVSGLAEVEVIARGEAAP